MKVCILLPVSFYLYFIVFAHIDDQGTIKELVRLFKYIIEASVNLNLNFLVDKIILNLISFADLFGATKNNNEQLSLSLHLRYNHKAAYALILAFTYAREAANVMSVEVWKNIWLSLGALFHGGLLVELSDFILMENFIFNEFVQPIISLHELVRDLPILDANHHIKKSNSTSSTSNSLFSALGLFLLGSNINSQNPVTETSKKQPSFPSYQEQTKICISKINQSIFVSDEVLKIISELKIPLLIASSRFSMFFILNNIKLVILELNLCSK